MVFQAVQGGLSLAQIGALLCLCLLFPPHALPGLVKLQAPWGWSLCGDIWPGCLSP